MDARTFAKHLTSIGAILYGGVALAALGDAVHLYLSDPDISSRPAWIVVLICAPATGIFTGIWVMLRTA